MSSANVVVKSNIYIRNGELKSDKSYIDKVKGRGKLEECIERLKLDTATQLNYFQRMLHSNRMRGCSEGSEANHHWGIIKEGLYFKHVCRCDKTGCKQFNICRYGITEEEVEEIKREMQTREKTVAAKQVVFQTDNSDISAFSDSTPRKTDTSVTGTKVIKNSDYFESPKTVFEECAEPEVECPNDLFEVVEQQEIVNSSYSTKMLVNAGPGTGKTWCLVERLKNIMAEGVYPDEIVVLCFSRAATAEIRKRLKQAVENGADFSLAGINIRTFDSFSTWLLYQLGKGESVSGKNYDERIEIAIREIKANLDLFTDMKHLVVDEIQDLVGVRARLVQCILQNSNFGFTLLGDSCQSIYDYQITDKKNELNSSGFYSWLYNNFGSQLKKYTLNGNKRQGGKLASFTDGLRVYILGDDVTGGVSVIGDFRNMLQNERFLGQVHKLDANTLLSQKTVSFLCRSNGEVLKLSSYLRNNFIPHSVQRLSTHTPIDGWVGRVFGEKSEDVIDFYAFTELCTDKTGVSDEVIVRHRWEMLKSVEGGQSSLLKIRDFIRNFQAAKGGTDSFYSLPASDVVVSTIHRAKGREYDNVVLLDSCLERFGKNPEIDELKVFYVALTRPRKGIWLAGFDKMKLDHGGFDDRWYQRGSGSRRNKMAHLEVGKAHDVDAFSFVDTVLHGGDEKVLKNQKYLRETVKTGDDIVLKKHINQHALCKIRYHIWHNDVCVGAMSDKFSESISNIVSEMRCTPFVNIQDYPEEIHQVFVETVDSHMYADADLLAPNTDRVHKETGVWNGIVLSGFGRVGNEYDW